MKFLSRQLNVEFGTKPLAMFGGMFTITVPSFSTDTMLQPVFDIAFPLFIAFFPIIGIVGGLALGFNLINKITKMFGHLGS